MTSIFDILATAPPAVEAEGGGVVSDIAATFKIQWPFFISQCISFLIVCLLLAKFAFGPIQKMLERRSNRIAEGEDKLERIERQLADSEKRTAEAIAKANDDAKRLIGEASDPDMALQQAVKQSLGQVLGMEVIPHFRSDPAILGGLVVRVGDRIMDGSVRRRMVTLRRKLLGT